MPFTALRPGPTSLRLRIPLHNIFPPAPALLVLVVPCKSMSIINNFGAAVYAKVMLVGRTAALSAKVAAILRKKECGYMRERACVIDVDRRYAQIVHQSRVWQ